MDLPHGYDMEKLLNSYHIPDWVDVYAGQVCLVMGDNGEWIVGKILCKIRPYGLPHVHVKFQHSGDGSQEFHISQIRVKNSG